MTVPEKHPHAVYGRAFALQDGTIILPCGWCGTPEWPGAEHHCPGVDAETVRRLEQE